MSRASSAYAVPTFATGRVMRMSSTQSSAVVVAVPADPRQMAELQETLVEEAARRLAQGTDPGVVPERFMIGAARFALDHRLAPAETIKKNFYQELARR